MNRLNKIFPAIVGLMMTATLQAYAAEPDANPLELSLEENIEVPEIPAKNKETVREINDNLRNSLERAGIKTSKLRQGEVLIISIPCSRLFRANENEISTEGQKLLQKFSFLDSYQTKYKLLIAVHTDDTGDESYADIITADRANALDDFFTMRLGLDKMIIIPYGIGRDEPLVTNDSIKNRAHNRRVEIYLVPQSALFVKNRK